MLTRISRARAALPPLKLKLAFQNIVVAPFYGAGWITGALWRAALWTVAALIAGYKAGNK